MKVSKSRTVGKAAAVFAAAVVCALLCRAVFPKPATLHNLDFIEYWTAFHIAGRGGNPYDPAAMLAMQRELGRAGTQPLMMWNPPFIFVLLYPVLQLPYAASAAVFFWVNVLLLIAAAVIFRSLYFPAGSPLSLPLLVTFLFYPVLLALGLGQVSVLLLFFLVLSFYCIENRRDILAGVMFAPVLVKPHLVYLVLLLLSFWAVRMHRSRILFSAVFAVGALSAAAHYLFPQVFANWYASFAAVHATGAAVSVYQWKVASLCGFIAAQLPNETLQAQRLVMLLVPGVSAIIVLIWFIRQQADINWARALVPLTCLSLFTSPYGWLFDHALLALCQNAVIGGIVVRSTVLLRMRIAALCMLVLLQVLILVLAGLSGAEHHQFFWLPLAMLVLWLLFRQWFAKE